MRSFVLWVPLLVACSGPRAIVQDAATDRAADLPQDTSVDVADVSNDRGACPLGECDEIGKPCTRTGNECCDSCRCLLLEGDDGVCTRACRPDDPATPVIVEDTCPHQLHNRCSGPYLVQEGSCNRDADGQLLGTARCVSGVCEQYRFFCMPICGAGSLCDASP